MFPLILRSSTLLDRMFRVSLCIYSLNLTATILFLQMSCPRFGIYNEILSPYLMLDVHDGVFSSYILLFD